MSVRHCHSRLTTFGWDCVFGSTQLSRDGEMGKAGWWLAERTAEARIGPPQEVARLNTLTARHRFRFPDLTASTRSVSEVCGNLHQLLQLQ